MIFFLFSRKNKKNISVCYLVEILSRVLSVNAFAKSQGPGHHVHIHKAFLSPFGQSDQGLNWSTKGDRTTIQFGQVSVLIYLVRILFGIRICIYFESTATWSTKFFKV